MISTSTPNGAQDQSFSFTFDAPGVSVSISSASLANILPFFAIVSRSIGASGDTPTPETSEAPKAIAAQQPEESAEQQQPAPQAKPKASRAKAPAEDAPKPEQVTTDKDLRTEVAKRFLEYLTISGKEKAGQLLAEFGVQRYRDIADDNLNSFSLRLAAALLESK